MTLDGENEPAGQLDRDPPTAMHHREAPPIDAANHRKAELRHLALHARAALSDKPQRSATIAQRALALPEFIAAATVMSYVSRGDEVETRAVIERAWQAGKRVAVPYCVGKQLQLFWLDNYEQLAPGTMGILEPRQELRDIERHAASPLEIELAVVPGVAWDRRGGRVGFGKGFYDRFLITLPPPARCIGLAFECQLFDVVPILPHDVLLQKVLTESATYPATSLPSPVSGRGVGGEGGST